MKPLGRLRRRLRLVSGMARATGVDLVAAHENGVLDQHAWAQMVQTCRRCRWSGRCKAWLADPARAAAPDAPPAECLNRSRLCALRAEEQALQNA